MKDYRTAENSLERLPPQSQEAEQAVLGALLVSGNSISWCADLLEPSHFYRKSHQLIYAAMLELNNKHEPTDIVTVSQALKDSGTLEQIGGRAYITELSLGVATTANLEYYARIVQEKSLLRQIIRAGGEIAETCFEESDPDVALNRAEQLLSGLHKKQNLPSLSDLLDTVRQELIEAKENGKPSGLSTGTDELDELLDGGFYKTDYVILAARPSIGKSALALQIGCTVAKQGGVVAYFSAEMPDKELLKRAMSGLAGIRHDKLKTGNLTQADIDCYDMEAEQMKTWRMHFFNAAGMTPRVLGACAREVQLQHGQLDLIIVDYIGLLEPNEKRKTDNTTADATAISKTLKRLTMSMNVPILCLSQLNRQLEGRTDRKPKLHDLRDTGALEQDANSVIFIHRSDLADTHAIIIVAKQRSGKVGEFSCTYEGDFVRFISSKPKGGSYAKSNRDYYGVD